MRGHMRLAITEDHYSVDGTIRTPGQAMHGMADSLAVKGMGDTGRRFSTELIVPMVPWAIRSTFAIVSPVLSSAEKTPYAQ